MKNAVRLDFEQSSFETDVPESAFYAALPIIRECVPRMPEHRVRACLNAISYLSDTYTPWFMVKNAKQIYRFYMRLKRHGLLEILRSVLKLPYALDIRRPTKKHGYIDIRDQRRKCGVCPRCGADSMVCRGTRRQGSIIVRHYRCRSCGSTALWISTGKRSWWKQSNTSHKKKHPT